jgi:hypothetical protein
MNVRRNGTTKLVELDGWGRIKGGCPMSDQAHLSETSKEFLKPAFEYEKLSEQDLLIMLLRVRLFEMQTYFMLRYRSGLDFPTSWRDLQLKSRQLQLTDDDVLTVGMFILRREWSYMLKEVYQRFSNKKVGMARLMDRQEELGRLWIQGRRLKVEADDTRQDGWVKGLEFLHVLEESSLEEHQSFLTLEAPVFPVEMSQFEYGFWNALLEETWSFSLKGIFGKVVPLVRGDAEKSTGKVDNFLIEARRTRQRRQRIMNGTENFPQDVPVPEGPAAELDKRFHSQIDNPEGYVLRDEDEEEQVRKASLAYEYALQRGGPQGEQFIDALKEHGKIAPAAAQVGFSRVTGHKYQKELRKILK